jgi:hypothetical protein
MPLSIADQRLSHHLLAVPSSSAPAAIVRWMGALQAQDYHQAIWALGVRLPHATVQQIEQALASGEIIRTWPMRGTIHFVPPEDAGWMVQLGAARMIAKDQRRLKQLELDTAIIGRCEQVVRSVLDGGKTMARPDLLQHIEDAGISTQAQRSYHILWYLAQQGVICLGPMRDKQPTFALLDQVVAQPRRLTAEEGLVELIRRYFASHGPATLRDFIWWTGLTAAQAKKGLEGAKPSLHSETIGGSVYWWGDAPPAPGGDQATALLLPGYDEYLLGYTDRRAVLDPQYAQRVCPGGNGMFYPMLVLDGQIVGTWKRTLKKKAVVISFNPFAPLSPADSARLEHAAQRYGVFWGLPVLFE